MSKILITGANGFVANYLKDIFPDDEVFLTDLKGEVINCDITDKKAILSLIDEVKPDEVYHLAAIASPRNEDRDLVFKVNVDGTINLLEAVEKIVPKAKVLLVSSGYVYGNCTKPAKETDPASPIGIYAESKLKMEQEAQNKFPSLNLYFARPFTHSGKGQQLGFFFPDMAKKIIEAKEQNQPVLEIYNPQTKRDFSHVKDVVEAYKMILKVGQPHEIYNVGSGKSYQIGEVTQLMAERAGLSNFTTKDVQHGVVLDLISDISKIKSLGFKLKFDLEDIINDFI